MGVLKKILLSLVVLGGWISFFATAQYFYFSTGSTTYPYQQGCDETISVYVNTEGNNVAVADLWTVFDPLSYYYDTSNNAATLRSTLFMSQIGVFTGATSDALLPAWRVPYTVLETSLYRDPFYNGNGLYGRFKFRPLHAITTGQFLIRYISGSSSSSSLSYGGDGNNDINQTSQNANLTGTYTFLQQPCVSDSNIPTMVLNSPTAGTKKSYLSGISLSLADAAGSNGTGNVPYIWTGGVWTGNPAGVVSNQYGINPATFVLYVTGNGTGKIFTQADGVLITGVNRTWQDNISNYGVMINSTSLFDYGIEKTITITGQVADRAGNLSTVLSQTINQPVAPSMIAGSQTPASNAIFVNLSAPIKIGIQDDWAGVNTGSIVLVLSGISGTSYGPYTYSGAQLNLSGVVGSANLPDQYITVSGHPDFPASGTIRVSVTAYDMAGTIDTISDYSFTTRPNCSEFQCCLPIDIKLGSGLATVYTGNTLTVFGGHNPFSSGFDLSTGYLYCGTENAGLSMYSGHSAQSGLALPASFFEGNQLQISGTNVVAYLTGAGNDTILLIRLGGFTIKVLPGSRTKGDYSNNGELRIYSQSKVLIATGSLSSSSTGSANFLYNVPSGTYYVVYKGQSHLASYLSGVVITQGTGATFDFTTGANLYSAEDGLGGLKYQTAGDLKGSQGYDFTINGIDLSILISSGIIDQGISVLDTKNLNGDSAINTADIGVLGNNFIGTDPFWFDEYHPGVNIFTW